MLYDKEKIRGLRENLGISRNELARRAGIKGSSMHAIEMGKTKNLKSTTLIGIAAALGVPIQDIMKVKPLKGPRDRQLEAVAVFSSLDDRNQQAMLEVMRSLAAQQKK